MEPTVRTERRFGVTADLSPNALQNLYALRVSGAWEDLLDVLEQCCIEVETVLINTDAEDEPKVLANHKMSKAAWMIFTHMQNKVNDATVRYMNATIPLPVQPQLSAEELERENILNPTVLLPETDNYT